MLPQKLKPHVIQKKGGAWDEVVTQLVVECLSHRTPPLSICPNIVSVVKLEMPNADIIKELPGIVLFATAGPSLPKCHKLSLLTI